MDVSTMVSEGLRTMGLGIGVVFLVLAVLFLVIRLMMRLWPAKDEEPSQ